MPLARFLSMIDRNKRNFIFYYYFYYNNYYYINILLLLFLFYFLFILFLEKIFLSMSCIPYIAHIIELSVLCTIPISVSFRYNTFIQNCWLYMSLANNLSIPTLSMELCQNRSLGPLTHIHLSFTTILFLQPSQDKHSINSTYLKLKSKLHFINNHYFMKHISNTLSITFDPCQGNHTAVAIAVHDVTLPLKMQPTILRAQSPGILNLFRTLRCNSTMN